MSGPPPERNHTMTKTSALRECLDSTETMINELTQDLFPGLTPEQRDLVENLLTACEGHAEVRQEIATRTKLVALSECFPAFAPAIRATWTQLSSD